MIFTVIITLSIIFGPLVFTIINIKKVVKNQIEYSMEAVNSITNYRDNEIMENIINLITEVINNNTDFEDINSEKQIINKELIVKAKIENEDLNCEIYIEDNLITKFIIKNTEEKSEIKPFFAESIAVMINKTKYYIIYTELIKEFSLYCKSKIYKNENKEVDDLMYMEIKKIENLILDIKIDVENKELIRKVIESIKEKYESFNSLSVEDKNDYKKIIEERLFNLIYHYDKLNDEKKKENENYLKESLIKILTRINEM